MSVARNYLILNTENKLKLYVKYVEHAIEFTEEMATNTGFLAENQYDFEGEHSLVSKCQQGEYLHTEGLGDD
jgi:hypothetical protein